MSAKIAFIFPGQGSQSVGMGKDLVEAYPVAKQVFEEADQALGFGLTALCFEGPEDALTLTTNTQPAILTTSIAALRVFQQKFDARAAFVAGHSLGEYSALVCGGALSFAEAVRTVRQRGEFMQAAVPVGVGTMAALIGLDREQVEGLCREVQTADNVVALANINSPEQYVISGHTEAVNQVVALAKAQGAKRAMLLPVSAPFHSPLMQPAADRLADALNALTFQDVRIPLVNNADAAILTAGADLRASLVRQMCSSVEWVRSMQLLVAQGVTTFVEIGPGKVLTGLLSRIDKQARGVNISDLKTLEKAMQTLAA